MKWLGKTRDEASKSNEVVVEKQTIVEEKGINEKNPKVINGYVPKVNEPLFSPLPPINVLFSFL